MFSSKSFLHKTLIALLILVQPNFAIAQDWHYTVRPGDTLWDIIDKYSVNLVFVPQLQSLNKIQNPKVIQPGTILTIPVRWLKKQPAEVIAKSVSGDVRTKKPGEIDLIPVIAGTSFSAGDMVLTESDGNVLLEFADQSTLVLRADSELIFDTLSQYSDTGMVDTRARLKRGRADARIKKLIGGGSRYEIQTPAATTTVRGTGYRISVDNSNEDTRAEVLEGLVAVDASGKSIPVQNGYGTVAKPGEPAIEPRELLPAPDLSKIPDLIEQMPLALKWGDLKGASSYRFQLSTREDFSILLEDMEINKSRVTGLEIAKDGDYYLRVRGRDDLELEGIDQVRKFTLNARPFAPLPMTPGLEQVIRHNKPEFKWAKPADSAIGRFQLSKNIAFSKTLIDQSFSNTQTYTLSSPLDPGTYFWRLSSEDVQGNIGPFSEIQSFTYVPPPANPEPGQAESSDRKLSLKWPAAEDGQRYQLQISKDSKFSSIITDITLDEPNYISKKFRSGTYYFKIATIDSDGTVGSFSPPQEFDIPRSRIWDIVAGIIIFLPLAL